MARYSHTLFLAVVTVCVIIVLQSPLSYGTDEQQSLRNRYQGKTFLLRGFYSGDWLLYSSSGELIKYEVPGDWTSDGFIIVDKVQLVGNHLLVDAKRLLVIVGDKRFEFRPALQNGPDGKPKRAVTVRIEVDFGANDPTDEQADATLSNVFLTERDSLAFLVPAYWRGCVRNGLLGKTQTCRFSPEISAVPGVALTVQSVLGSTSAPASSTASFPAWPTEGSANSSEGLFRVGGGVTPPKPIHSPEPVFSDAARSIKYQGVLTLGLVVSKEGVPGNIRVLSPLGAGLDEKAVHAVETWRFQPAEKDGQPVRVEIAVEVNFHLF